MCKCKYELIPEAAIVGSWPPFTTNALNWIALVVVKYRSGDKSKLLHQRKCIPSPAVVLYPILLHCYCCSTSGIVDDKHIQTVEPNTAIKYRSTMQYPSTINVRLMCISSNIVAVSSPSTSVDRVLVEGFVRRSGSWSLIFNYLFATFDNANNGAVRSFISVALGVTHLHWHIFHGLAASPSFSRTQRTMTFQSDVEPSSGQK